MTLFGVLNRGTTGMRTAQYGTETAAQNASNVNTPGYSRQRAVIEPLGPRPLGGSRATGSRRVIDQFLERRILGARSYEGEASAKTETLGILDVVLADGPGSIGDALDSFQQALSDLSSDPQDRTTRTMVIQRADQLSRAFNTAGAELTTARADVNERISGEVSALNDKLYEIADLGRQIAKYGNTTGDEAGELLDRRDELVREVSDTVPVKVIAEADGQISLMLAGSLSLVTPDGQVNELRATPDATSGDVFIHRTNAGMDEDITQLINTGRVGGYITARDGALTEARDDLDQLASDVATAYNAAHTAGVGLDGASGRNLFTPPTGVAGAAEALSVSTDVLGQPDNVGAATDPASVPGDNRGALALLEVGDSDVALGGTATLNEGFGALIASAGGAVQGAMLELDHAETISAQLSEMRGAVSGVSTDEEMIDLMRFQRAYQASLQVIQTADEMLGDLMRLKR